MVKGRNKIWSSETPWSTHSIRYVSANFLATPKQGIRWAPGARGVTGLSQSAPPASLPCPCASP
jgi:hypothetical protein